MNSTVHRRTSPRTTVVLIALLAMLASIGFAQVSRPAHAADPLISQGKTATASSTENAGTPASAAVDGNLTTTRWSSAFADPQWLQVDLGATATISQVVLTWEAAYGKSFQIQTSPDAATWTSIYSTTTGTGGTQTLTVSGSGRYVRMYGTVRGTAYGYSLYELQVYGTFPTAGGCSTTNAAQGKTATASSTENAGTPASAAVDGNTGTRWSSAFADPQWLQVDLGSTQSICQVTLNWEAAYASAFQIQTSPDATTWTSIFSTTTGTGGVQTLTVSGSGRYVRMYGTARGTAYGYSLWEFGVYTGTGGGNTGVCPTQSDTPDFGPNVHVFDPSMSAATIQAQLNTDFAAQKDTNTAQFANGRVAELYKPGTYAVEDNVGFYTTVAGLGLNPDDVTINGDVTVDAFNSEDAGNATQNFWREADNLAINPSSGSDRWAVAQAAPFRRIDVHGNLQLQPASNGYASGGYISDTKVSGQVSSVSQQQWYSQNSNFGSWAGGVWNMVFAGVTGAPAASFPSPPETVLATTPVSRDIPYLYVTTDGKYHVFVPSLRTNASGTSWPNTAGSSLAMSTFYVVKAGDTATTINAALANGCNLFFTPGVYHVSSALNVTKAGTVVLGIGYPTIIPDGGVSAMNVADVDGVRIKGLLFSAGTTNSAALLTIGTSTAAHAANPISVQDVFFRIGGDAAGKATQSLVVNASNTLIDHVWAWRADHGTGVGWTSNTADTGLTVNGNNVEATGLFVEHYQKYEVIWNGTGGSIIFFQNENPYDPPNQAAWMNGSLNGYAAIKVNSSASGFQGWGWGSYCYFNVNPAVNNYHAFEVPTSGVTLHNLATVSLGNVGTITHVVNDTGAVTPTNTTPSDVISFP
ncbi:discoidin domain-containing protein [Acidothermaceae bacterium B102]|nr:discoidin domain-containing protein [Acidothermaceae bacterium B102]